ncbi:MAG: hypothetical protein SGI92_26285 [Bryobacteraceae bacterium]|nr:hypothetical protein [Bryobacteraceae bacterium]
MRFPFYVVLALALVTGPVQGQESPASSEVGTRQLWDESLQRLRPPDPRRQAARKTTPRPAAKGTSDEPLSDAFVAVTLWQLRPSRGSDEQGTRLLVHEEETGSREELTPERVSADAPLAEGARVRVSIEPARAGYLYVVDREQYSDGSFSDPWLIFPTMQIRGGNSRVEPGTVVEIPDASDKTPYLRLRRNRARKGSAAGEAPEQVSEVLTVLVSPTPLPGLQIGRAAQKLPVAQFQKWEQQWATQTKSIDAPALAGKAYTAAEKRAGQEGGVLTESDPLPQTIIQTQAKAGDTMLVTLPIKINRK